MYSVREIIKIQDRTSISRKRNPVITFDEVYYVYIILMEIACRRRTQIISMIWCFAKLKYL